jgi:hypothetical protein
LGCASRTDMKTVVKQTVVDDVQVTDGVPAIV